MLPAAWAIRVSVSPPDVTDAACPARAAPAVPSPGTNPPYALPCTPMVPRPSARPSILVVDDDVTLLQLIGFAIADVMPDADVRLTSTAREGESAAVAWTPDVILCDIHLPDDDGRHLLARLRTRPELAHVPGVLMTGLDISSRLLREEACSLRADLLRKPFDLVDLLRLVGRALSGRIAV
jgi:CheY-like chemotaxis protein